MKKPTKLQCAAILRMYASKYMSRWEPLKDSNNPQIIKMAIYEKSTADAYYAAAMLLENGSSANL